MNKTQELKERIYKHCPELKELSFGCLIKVGENVYDIYVKDIEDGSHMFSTTRWHGKILQEQILGHPIHLEHVLRAMQESYFDLVYYPALTGNEMKLNICAKGKEVNYSLTKSFEQNCENTELVDFLLEVIK